MEEPCHCFPCRAPVISGQPYAYRDESDLHWTPAAYSRTRGGPAASRGPALAYVMTAEVAAEQTGAGGRYRGEAWRAAGATGEGTAILLHYTAMRLASEVRAISQQLPADLGVMSAAAGVAQALKLLLEVCTVRSIDDPRAAAVTANLARASDQLATVAEGIEELFAAARDTPPHFPAGIAQNELAACPGASSSNPDLTRH